MSVFACENMLEKEILVRQVKEKQGMTNNDEGSISFQLSILHRGSQTNWKFGHVQTKKLFNQLEVRRAQSRQLRVCCAQNKGEHKIWNDCQKKEKLSDYLSLTDADPALLFFYYWNWEF